MQFVQWFQKQVPGVSLSSAESVLKMHTEGATIPFMARYRKEQTGNLDEVAIQNVIETKNKWDEILKRQTFILGEIEHQKKLTPELKKKIEATFDADTLEDLYLPYKQKRKTKATIAKEAGLEPLALCLWDVGQGDEEWNANTTVESVAQKYVDTTKGIESVEAALKGATDILVEKISENAELRDVVRKTVFAQGKLTSKKAEAKEFSKFERYFEYSESIASLLKPENSHRVMAMKRGFMEKELSLSISGDYEDGLLAKFQNFACPKNKTKACEILYMAARLALKAYVAPSIDTEVHRELKDIADKTSIHVFAENVKKVLLSAPFGAKAVLGIDPGIRTGCKLAVVNSSGQYLANTVIYLNSDSDRKTSKTILLQCIAQAKIEAIAIGNGTASRETESFVRDALKSEGLNVPVLVVSESGASIYSASAVAREEFPDLDLTVRGAISIARRLQDPLAELVKVDPKSIGVGQYQHDVNQSALKKSLDLVVETCVNSVGVNLNTSSSHLLAHVSGIGAGLAKAIVEYRTKKGAFGSRQDLLKVPRFSDKIFEQAAGFLRIPNSANPLDNTGVHPERYPLLENLAKTLGCPLQNLIGKGAQNVRNAKTFRDEVGEFTFGDIVKELERPGLDPRDTFEVVAFRDDIHEVKDLKPDMVCPGIVTNVTNFGAFVDIGVHQDGLVHISQLSDNFVKDPREVVSPGDRVMARVISVDTNKNQIALTLKSAEAAQKVRREQTGFGTSAPKPSGKPQNKPQPVNTPFNNPFAALKNMK